MKKIVGVVLLVFLSTSIAITAQKANPASDFEYDISSDGEGITIKKYLGSEKNVIIPSVIEDFPVVELQSGIFKETDIESVVIPDSINYLGVHSFEACKSLEKVTLSKNLKSIGRSCFEGCKSLKEITLFEKISYIDILAFAYSGLESITISNGITEIGSWAFAECKNLKTVVIGNGLQDIANGVFFNCTALTTVTIGDGLEMIGNKAFSGCTALTTVTIGDGLEIIEERAFDSCTALTYVTIGSGLKRICGEVFNNCSALTNFDIGEHELNSKDAKFSRVTIEYDIYGHKIFHLDRTTIRRVYDGILGFRTVCDYNDTKEYWTGYGYNAFSGCSSLSLKEKKKIRDTGYTGEF